MPIYLVKISLKYKSNVVKNFCFLSVIKEKSCFNNILDFHYLSSSVDFILNQNCSNLNVPEKIKNWLFSRKKHRLLPVDVLPIFFSKDFDLENISLRNKSSKLKVFLSLNANRQSKDVHNIPMVEIDGRSVIGYINQNDNFIDFNEGKTPLYPGFYIKNNLSMIPLFAIGMFSVLFKNRPIWIKHIIEYQMPLFFKKYLKKLLPTFCYQFKCSNPYGQAWIRFGYNPRKERESVIYQSFNVKWILKINHNKKKKKIVKQKQLCDIKNKRLKIFISEKFKFQKQYVNYLTGWLSNLNYLKIKKIIRSIYENKSITSVSTL
jgi:hypothetical protein